MHSRILLAGITALQVNAAVGDETLPYPHSLGEDEIERRLGWRIEEHDISLATEVTLRARAGTTRVLPRVTSAWSASERFDLNAVFRYRDWNAGVHPLSPEIDTGLRYRPSSRYIEGILATFQPTREESAPSVELRFAELDTGISLLGGDPLGLEADLSLQPSREGILSSRFASTWAIGETLGIEGKLMQRSDGGLRQALALRFPGVSSDSSYGPPLTLTSRAVVTETLIPGEPDAVHLGLETRLAGFAPLLLGGENALSLTLERRFATGELGRAALSYDHSWTPELGAVGLKLDVLGDVDALEPSLDITWEARF